MITTSLLRAKMAVATSAIALSALTPAAHQTISAPHPAPPAAPPTVSMAVELAASITSDGSSQTVGVADAYLYTLNQTQLVNQLNEIRSLGVTDLRIVVPWIYIQPTSATTYNWGQMDNVINTAHAMGFTLTASITGNPTWDGTPLVGAPNPNTYATFAAAVAQRYANQINAYEVWNEPNAVTFMAPSDPATYTAILKAAYTAIKAVNPSATVIAGVLGAVTTVPGMSVSPQQFLAGMYAAGAQGFFDALSFHPYNYTLPFSAGAGIANSPLEQVKALYALMTANGDAAKQIWATEFGNPTMPGGITQTQQAQMLRDFVTAWSKLSFAGPSFVYTANDLNTGYLLDENNLGLFTTDGIPKLAAQTLAALIKQLAAGPLPAYTAPQLPAAQTLWIQLVSFSLSVVNEALLIPNIVTKALYNAAPAPLQQAFSTVAHAVSLAAAQTLNAITPAAETGINMLINFPTSPQAAAHALGASFYGTEVTIARALASVGIGAAPKPAPAPTPAATSAIATTAVAPKPIAQTTEAGTAPKPTTEPASSAGTTATGESGSTRTDSKSTAPAPTAAPVGAAAPNPSPATTPTSSTPPATTATGSATAHPASPATAAPVGATATGALAKPAATPTSATPSKTAATQGAGATTHPTPSSKPTKSTSATGSQRDGGSAAAGKHSNVARD
ncbi:MAG: hypothetical protein EKK51_24325 [Mycolicibacterium sp.]|uniref:Uncharacterized protein n=2 Tax=Mycobacterium avium TaxID=1764 RepID=A0A2A2ZAY8_MYCAV|nr:cellulase family glycosylhydrolase [Mycolicibacterium sp.]PBA23611.1 hypothetical protein CKJ66_27720 [Mycobacterium avium]RUP28204.1 MAG: hypothetical protein EKK51_24325 [Mycolicibacterium sp.]